VKKIKQSSELSVEGDYGALVVQVFITVFVKVEQVLHVKLIFKINIFLNLGSFSAQ
jgi:hypothetical protein